MADDFVHLHSHTEYSITDGCFGIDAWVKAAKEKGFTAMAVTEHGNLSSALQFYKKMREAEIKPIIGIEAYLAEEDKQGKADHAILLAKDLKGFENLIRLNNKAWREGFYRTPRMRYSWLPDYAEGLIMLSGCLKGRIPQLVWADKLARAKAFLQRLREIFGDDLYLEVQFNDMEQQRKVNMGALDLSQSLSVPTVLTNDNHYICKGDEVVQAHMLQLGRMFGVKYETHQIWMKSRKVLGKAWKQWHSEYFALEKAQASADMTLEVSKKCNLELPLGQFHIPSFDFEKHPCCNGHKSSIEFFKDLIRAGWEKKIKPKLDEANREIYKKRVVYELEAFVSLGFVDYMLIVEDICRYAREQSIPMGMARGSVAGSLIAYVLDITKVDPIEHDLLFERFLNPTRAQMAIPDIDLDFAADRREQVREYIIKKYGSDHVAAIGSYTRIHLKGALKDILRIHDIDFKTSNALTKTIRDDTDIKAAQESSPAFRKWCKENPSLLWVLEKMIGAIKAQGRHPAGMVIAPSAVDGWMPLRYEKGKDGKRTEAVTQWEDKWVEARGLVKFDILGIDQLSMLAYCLRLIEKRHGKAIRMEDIPLDDPKVYEAFANGHTAAIFQFNSPLLTGYLKRLKPDRFEHLVVSNALIRPGPKDAGMHEKYLSVRHGKETPELVHPSMLKILPKTFGIIVFQEDVMKLAQDAVGYSPVESEQLRRAIAKKKKEDVEKHRDLFMQKLKKRGWDVDDAKAFFETIETHSQYSFNRSHCVTPETPIYDIKKNRHVPIISLYRAYQARKKKMRGTMLSWVDKKFIKYYFAQTLSLNPSPARLRKGRIRDVVCVGRKPAVEMLFSARRDPDDRYREYGTSIRVAPSTLFLLRDGSYISAENLIPGTRVYGYFGGRRRLVTLEKKNLSRGMPLMFDLIMEEEPHNFLAGNLFVHNSVGYSLLAYASQWLKIHFPHEFWSGVLTHSPNTLDDPQGVFALKDRAKIESGIEVVPPDINRSGRQFKPTKEGLLWPILQVRAVGEAALYAIDRAREKGPFKSFDDFVSRMKGERAVTKKVVIALVLAGAFREFGGTKDILLRYYELRDEDAPKQIRRLSDFDWSYLQEQAVGFIHSIKELFSKNFGQGLMTMAEFQKCHLHDPVVIGGHVMEAKKITTRGNRAALLMTVSDTDGSWRVPLWSDTLKEIEVEPQKGDVVEIFGRKGRGDRAEVEVETCTLIYRPEDIFEHGQEKAA